MAGGGPAGAVAALTLARAGRRVLLAERRPAQRFKIGEALPGAARPLLRDLGLWDAFVADGHLPSYGSARRGAAPRRGTPTSSAIRTATAGMWIAAASRACSCAPRRARPGVELLEGAAPCAGANASDRRARGSVRARAAIDATGRSAALARRPGAPGRSARRRLRGVPAARATWTRARCSRPTADGWWYTALVPGTAPRRGVPDRRRPRAAPACAPASGFLRPSRDRESASGAVGAAPMLGPHTARSLLVAGAGRGQRLARGRGRRPGVRPALLPGHADRALQRSRRGPGGGCRARRESERDPGLPRPAQEHPPSVRAQPAGGVPARAALARAAILGTPSHRAMLFGGAGDIELVSLGLRV